MVVQTLISKGSKSESESWKIHRSDRGSGGTLAQWFLFSHMDLYGQAGKWEDARISRRIPKADLSVFAESLLFILSIRKGVFL